MEHLMVELGEVIETEAKASKAFYERQMKETPVFDDSYKEGMISEIRQRALLFADEKKSEAQIEAELGNVKV
jgi:hypothetical protein